MATKLQDYQAKRKELQATNPNATMLDAKSAISPAPIANAPVAGQAPTITNPVGQTPTVPTAPTAPVSVHDNQNYQSNITEQYNRGVLLKNKVNAIGKKINSMPENQIQQKQLYDPSGYILPDGSVNPSMLGPNETNQPNHPTQPVTSTVETPKVETPPPEAKKEQKPAEVTPPPITIGDMYNNLVNRIDVTPEMKALPTFKIAQNRYNKANMYSSMSPAELSSEMKNAKLVEGSPAWEDLKTMNPALVQSVKALNTVNGVKPEIFTYVNNPDGTRTKQNNLENTFVSDYEDNYGDIVDILKGIYGGDTAEEARNKIYTQDVRNAEAKATEIELKMNALSDTIAGIDKDVEKEFAGTGATGSRIALEKQYRNEQLTNQYKSLEKNYTTYANKANNLITQNTDLYKSEQEQKKQLQSALAGVALKNYGMQAEADFARKQAYENLNDPALAISNVMEEYKKLGIPFTSTVQSRLAEFQASGKPLAQFLTEMTQNIQQSPGYKAYEAKKAGEGTSYVQYGDKVYKNVNGVLTEANISTKSTRPDWVMDSTTGTWIDRNTGVRPDIQALSQAKGQTLLDAPDGMVIPSRLSETTNPNGGKECAEYVNDITGIGLGNSWESKKSKIDDTIIVPETGDTAIWIPDPSNKTFAKYGHAGVVTDVSEDGSTVTIKSSNLNGDGAISTITVPISQIDQTGGFAKSSIKGQGTSQNSGLKTLGEYIIDTQPRGAGFSDADAKAFTDSVNKYVKAGDSTTVYQMLRDKILQNKQVGETIYDNAELKSGLSNLKTILSQYKTSGGDTGILSNIAETVANKLGTTTDVQLAKAKNQLGILVADYIRAISGTAASDTEVQRLIGNMPQMKNVDSFNMTLLDNLENIANRRVQSKLDIYLGSKKNEGKNLFPEFYGEIQQQPQQPPQQPQDNELDSLYNSL